MTPEQAAALRAPFPPEAIGKLPKAGTTLDYVGHAATTDRLLQVDADWTWEPPTKDELERLPSGDGMWIKLTVAGVTRFGWGDGKNIKEWISDAIRNASMRFGVALDLWSKEDLHSPASSESAANAGPSPSQAGPATSKLRRENIKARCVALQADNVSVADKRAEWQLPTVDNSDDHQLGLWEEMLTELEAGLAAPFSSTREVTV